MSAPLVCKARFRRLALRSANARRKSRKYAEVAGRAAAMFAELAGGDDVA